MLSKLFKSKAGIENCKVVRDIMIEFLEDIKTEIKNKEEIDKIINKIKKSDISITELLAAYKELIMLSERSLYDNSLKYKGSVLPINPINGNTIKKIKDLIERS